MIRKVAAITLTCLAVVVLPLLAQRAPGQQSSPNIHVLSHFPVGRGPNQSSYQEILDIDVEQELSRPYVYVSHLMTRSGFDIISVKDPRHARMLYQWTIANPELHTGIAGGFNPRYFKLKGRYYVAVCFQYKAGSPDNDLGAIIFDVTGLPDTSTVKEVARIHAPETPGGFHNLFPYRHSDGRVLLFTTAEAVARLTVS